EAKQAKREIAAKQEAAQPVPPEIGPQDIIFEGGKAIISPHVHLERPVSTTRLTFQGEETLDIPSNLEFIGLDEKGFHVAYDAFLKTQTELRGITGAAPPLKRKFWRDRGR